MQAATPKTYFISRHPGAVAWVESEGFHVDHRLAHFDVTMVQPGDRILSTRRHGTRLEGYAAQKHESHNN